MANNFKNISPILAKGNKTLNLLFNYTPLFICILIFAVFSYCVYQEQRLDLNWLHTHTHTLSPVIVLKSVPVNQVKMGGQKRFVFNALFSLVHQELLVLDKLLIIDMIGSLCRTHVFEVTGKLMYCSLFILTL